MYKLIGKRLDGRYEFLELIGVGGMAEVYRAYDNVKRCDVAVKVLKEEFSKNVEFVRRFQNESKANASLSHPNIVRIFDVDFGDRIQYIVMEFVDGVTLKEFIKKVGVLDWKDVVHFTFQILRALQHAHDKGIVHRDIKPQNVMLLEDGTIKIMDFGIARFARDEKISVGKAIGSVHYISPEQASGSITDEKSDLYSVGIMMYEMLTGRLPFEGKTAEIVAVKQIQSHAQSPLELNPSIPPGLVDIVCRAMQKRPEKRYQSATEMLRDIDEFKKNPDVLFEYKYLTDESNTQYFTLSEKENMKNIDSDDGFQLKKNQKSKSVMAKNKKEKLIPILLGVAAGVFLVAVLIIGVFLFGRNNSNADELELPSFVGMRYEDIKNFDGGKCSNLRFILTYEDSTDYDEGVVCRQTPSSGLLVKKDSEVKLTLSSGSKKEIIPNVRGKNYKDAQWHLNQLGFKNLKLVRKPSEIVSQDIVISTDPIAGKQVGLHEEIVIYYSSGIVDSNENLVDEIKKSNENLSEDIKKNNDNVVKVPNVVGKNVDEAKSELKKAGFEVSVVEKFDEKFKEGIVISQNKNKEVLKGSKIELIVNKKDKDLEKKLDKNLNTENGDPKLKSEQSKEFEKRRKVQCSIPLNSFTPVNDTFNVVVTDSKGKVVCEGKYGAEGVVNFSTDGVNEETYKIKITNTATKKSENYGLIKINFKDDFDPVSYKLDSGAFARTVQKPKDETS